MPSLPTLGQKPWQQAMQDFLYVGHNPDGTNKGGGKNYATITVGSSGVANPASYDFICDGTADEVEINAAIAAIPGSGGRIILSEGTFSLTGGIVVNKYDVAIEGQGTGTVLGLNSAINTSVLTLQGAGNACIRNLILTGNGANQTVTSYGIWIKSDSPDAIIEGVGIQNTRDHNIYVQGADARIEACVLMTTRAANTDNIYSSALRTRIIGCRLSYPIKACIEHATTGGANDASYGLISGNNLIEPGLGCCILADVGTRITDNHCVWTGAGAQGGSAIIHAKGDSIGYVGRNVIDGNFIVAGANAYMCIYTERGDDVISNNYIVSAATVPGNSGIQSNSNRSTIVGNRVILTGATGAGSIYGIIGYDFCTVTGNHVMLTGDRQACGIYLGDYGGTITANVLIDNAAKTQPRRGIEIGGSGTVEGNSIADFATGIIVYQTNVACVGNYITNADIGINVMSARHRCTIIGNSLSGRNASSTKGILATACDHLTISENAITNFRNEGIDLASCRYCAVNGNTITEVGLQTTNAYSAIMLRTTTVASAYNTINGNTIRNNAANKPQYGVRENTATDGPNIVTANVVLTAATAQISTQHASSVAANNLTV